jgi:catechol 2,3-dioxygenase-like lactoylglutathione lyase family enzyme
MEQRFSLITLGVADLARARRFYEAMGWHSDTDPELGVVFFQCPGTVLALWGRDELAADSGVVDGGGWGGCTPASCWWPAWRRLSGRCSCAPRSSATRQ